MGCIRFLLALSVIIAHSESILGLKLIGGSAAVEIFFIISGFYMALILKTKYVNKSDYSLFISNRFLKIYPVYFVSIFLTCLISIVSIYAVDNFGSFDVYNQNLEHLDLCTLITLALFNLVIFGQDVIMFLGINLTNSELFFTTNFRESTPHLYEFMLNPPAWSISVELLFYIVAPFILRKSAFIILGIALLSLGIKVYLSYGLGLKHDPWSYRFFPSELMFFMLGAIAYNVYTSEIAKKFKVFNKKSNLIFLGLLLLAIFTYGYFYKLKYFLYLVSFISLPFIFDLSKRSKLDRAIGELSYPMYILHFLVIMLFDLFLSEMNLFSLKGEIVAALTIILSIIAIKFVMEPIELYRQRRVRQKNNKTSRSSFNLLTSFVSNLINKFSR